MLRGENIVVSKIGVIGAGVMGRNIALLLTQHGFKVILMDKDKHVLECVLDDLKKSYYMYSPFCDYFSNPNIEDSVILTSNIEALVEAEIIIENITEDFEAKKKLYKELDGIISEESVLIANTSCIQISEIAKDMQNKTQIVGVHFMNPPLLIHTVELIRSKYSSKETVEKTCEFLERIEKKFIKVGDSAGFVSNRISHLMMNEAFNIIDENIATPEEIDLIFKQCYGHKMGPIETADLIGLDTVYNSLKVLCAAYPNEKFKISPLLERMIELNLYGRKTGKGFYDYSI